MKSTVLTFIHN